MTGTRRTWPRRVWAAGLTAIGAIGVLGTTGCSLDGLLNTNQPPNNITDPAISKTPKGALTAYHGVQTIFRQAFGGNPGEAGSASALFSRASFVVISGVLSDELVPVPVATTAFDNTNRRQLAEGGYSVFDRTTGAITTLLANVDPYYTLQMVRGNAAQAIGLLNDFADPAQPELVAHTYALEAYAEVFLAELFCSGVPLSTVDYNGNFTAKPGSSTNAVLNHAVALFDTAIGLAGDSTRFLYLASVGKGRALLGLGQFAAAAAAVSGVPDDFQYLLTYSTGDSTRNFAYAGQPASPFSFAKIGVGDAEGTNGLTFVTSADPRVPTTFVAATTGGTSGAAAHFRPTRYAADGSSPIAVASAVEARLIEAEAALQGNDIATWLAKLNALRATQSIPDVTDPGSTAARVDTLFKERAFWLYLTGHRQGDLRRLIRQYGRQQDQVYPVGVFMGYPYGSGVNLPLPSQEILDNSYVTGCASRDA